jgi:hypothetical protein
MRSRAKQPSTEDAAEVRYSELLEKSLGKITLAMHGAVDNCISAMHRDKLSDVELYALTGSVHSTFETLARSVAQELENVIEAAQQSSRQALKAQAVTFALKLETSRTAAAVTLEARATELEADMHRKLEEALLAMAEGSLLTQTHAELEAVRQELAKLKLKSSNVDEAMGVLKEMLRTSENTASDWKSKHDALAETEAALQVDSHGLRRENLEAHAQLDDALTELGIKIEENMTLSEQITILVAQTGDGEAVRRERDALSEKARMLQGALAKLDAAQQERAAQLDAANAELVTLRSMPAELTKARVQLAERHRELTQAEARHNAVAAELVEMRRAAGGEGQRLEQLQTMTGNLWGIINSAMASLEDGFKRLGLNAPAPGSKGKAGRTVQIREPFEGEGDPAEAPPNLEARVEVLTSYCVTMMATLEQSMADLAASRTAHAELEQRNKALSATCARHERAATDLSQQLVEKQSKLDEVQKKLDAATAGGAGLNSKLAFGKAEVAKLRMEMRLCCTKLDAVLPPADGAAAAAGRQAAADAAANGIADDDESWPPAELARRVEQVVLLLGQVRTDLALTADALGAARSAFKALQTQMGSADDIGNAKVAQVKLEEQQKRAALVTSALESLRHLRSHLIKALSGLREVPGSEGDGHKRPKTAPGKEMPPKELTATAFEPQPEYWQVRGLPNEMVIRVELPQLSYSKTAHQQRKRVVRGLSFEAQGSCPRSPFETAAATAAPHSARAAVGGGHLRLARNPLALAEKDDLAAPAPLGRDDAVALRSIKDAAAPRPPTTPRVSRELPASMMLRPATTGAMMPRPATTGVLLLHAGLSDGESTEGVPARGDRVTLLCERKINA